MCISLQFSNSFNTTKWVESIFWRSIFITDFHFHKYYFHFHTYCQHLHMSIFCHKSFCWNVSSKLCKTAPSEIILSHYIAAAGGMNALWPKLSTSSERIFIKYISIDIKNGSISLVRILKVNSKKKIAVRKLHFTSKNSCKPVLM